MTIHIIHRAILFLKRVKKMKNRETYDTPELELIKLGNMDIIATSGEIDNDIEPDLGENDGEWM